MATALILLFLCESNCLEQLMLILLATNTKNIKIKTYEINRENYCSSKE